MNNDSLEEIEKLKLVIKKQVEKINLLEAVINDIPGSIYWKDKEGVFLGCNTFSIEKLKSQGINQGSIIGKTNDDLFPEEIARQYEYHDLQVINTGSEVCVEEKAPDGKGGFLIQLSYKKPIKDLKGNIIGIMGNTIDITHLKLIESDLRKTKRQLEIANKVKTEFLQNMRHDIRTPITGIIGCAELIKKSKNNFAGIEKYSNILIQSSKTLLDFLNDVLDSIQMNSGEVPLLKKKFNLKLVLAEVIKINQAKVCEKQLDLRLEYDSSIPKYLIGDSRRVYRVILELVTNALKYTQQGGAIVAAELAKNENGNVIVKISVKDTGIGILPDKQKEIFTRFKRFIPSSQGIYDGAGLGLSIIKQLLDDLDAEIYVVSEMNKGSIFTCIIPFKEALLAEEFGVDLDIKLGHQDIIISSEFFKNLPDLERSLSSPGRILLVEDHAITAKITKAILSDFNYQIDIASTGEMAINLTEKNHYDIVFMDIGLPDISGYEVTQKIRANQKNKFVPIIGLTSHISSEDKRHCVDIGMNAVFIKPLMQEKIEDIFNIFVLGQNELKANRTFLDENDDSKALLFLTGNVIDLEIGIRLAGGNEVLAYEILSMFIDSLPEELAKMDIAYKAQDWETVESILHKLRSGTSYCGVPRFKEACVRFDDYLKSGKKELIEDLYQQLLSEFEKLKQKME